MILVDTSVWIDHFRAPDLRLIDLIRRRRALIHPYVLSEVLMGNLRDWARTVAGLQSLPRARVISADDLAVFVADRGLPGSGLSFVDAHLLATVLQASEVKLWTRDKRLETIAADLGLAWAPA